MTEDLVRAEREAAYEYYKQILDGQNPEPPTHIEERLNDLSDDKKYTFWMDKIVGVGARGKDYFFGKVVDEMYMTPSHSKEERRIIFAQPVCKDFKGIKTFEAFSRRSRRPVLLIRGNVIAIASSAQQITEDDELRDKIRYSIDTASRLRNSRKS